MCVCVCVCVCVGGWVLGGYRHQMHLPFTCCSALVPSHSYVISYTVPSKLPKPASPCYLLHCSQQTTQTSLSVLSPSLFPANYPNKPLSVISFTVPSKLPKQASPSTDAAHWSQLTLTFYNIALILCLTDGRSV